MNSPDSLEKLAHYLRRQRASIRFDQINAAAMAALPLLLARWLPSGRRDGDEWVALNPTRPDRHLGSFRINCRTGRWADFATSDRGSDPVSLCAFLFGLRQSEAAMKLAATLGIETSR